MANVDNDDPYGDDDLDDLPLNTINAFEEHAFQATQSSRQGDLSKSFASQAPRYHTNGVHQATSIQAQKRAPSDDGEYGSVEDGDYGDVVLDDNAQPYTGAGDSSRHHDLGEVTQRELWRLDRFGGSRPSNQHIWKRPIQDQPQNKGFSRPTKVPHKTPEVIENDQDRMVIDSDKTGIETTANGSRELQAQINQLLREREELLQSLQKAESTALSKAGEISIVRANQAKAHREYERKLAVLQSTHTDEAAKQRAELESLAAERERVVTDNKFLKRDLVEEAERVKNLKRNINGSNAKPKGYPGSKPSPLSTPDKAKALAYRDGFDDAEIQMSSPSKGLASRSKNGTPKLGAKRKRKIVDDSPGKPLQLSPAVREDSDVKENSNNSRFMIDEELLRRFGRQDTRFEVRINTLARFESTNFSRFFQLILNHCPDDKTTSTFETLTTLHFPSSPHKSLSSIILSKVSESEQTSKEELPQQISKIFISVWSQCIEEEYHVPIMLFVDMTTFILLLDTITVAPDLISSLLPIAQSTIDRIGVPRWQQHLPASLDQHIEIYPCLSLLHLIAMGSAQHDIQIRHFWQHFRFDVVLMMLSTKQFASDVFVVLDMLATSVFSDSFGPILTDNEGRQRSNEDYILDFITLMLEPLKPPPVHSRFTPAEMSTLQISILHLLTHISQTPYGSSILAEHKNVIGRLFRFASDTLDRLYDHRAQHINHATKLELAISLLHQLCVEHPNIDVGAKVTIIPGGAHKRLVTLTRLAFSEGLMLEEGIGDKVAMFARDLLENTVTPEEGETLEMAMAKTKRRWI